MKPTITIYDYDHNLVGSTFPRRAKSLVNQSKAKWLDETHKIIQLCSPRTASTQHPRDKSFVKDLYRDDDETVMQSTPLEIIKKSKRRTRTLHTIFSVILWSTAAIVYFSLNFFVLGNRALTINPQYLSGTWLIFVAALLLECLVEIYFCRKELAVLAENIDLRQFNPHKKTDDLNLHDYKKKLTRKIRIMSSGTVWLVLVLVYFMGGYQSGRWGLMGLVFIPGAVIEAFMYLTKDVKITVARR